MHTAENNNGWKGVYGRLNWERQFRTTITNPEPTSTQGTVIHPSQVRKNIIKKWAIPGLFLFILSLFQTNITFLQQINVKNVHPEYGAWIRTEDFQNMSLLP